jgi:O-acetyl-ADP-ribose deacetylase (regulator of RNase III)
MVRFRHGDILRSQAQTLVNTVNCVGVMGKGVALAFRRAYPEMYRDYVARCRAGEVLPGRPYLYKTGTRRQIINFPTKGHWRSDSRISDVRGGLAVVRTHLSEWGIDSLAFPALGCGNGGLDWADVKPLIAEAFADTPIDVEVYEPGSESAPIDATVAIGEADSPNVVANAQLSFFGLG